MSKYDEYNREDATHVVMCAHAIGRSRKEYTMDCIPLKDMGDGRWKILVFGERNWKGYENKKGVRYVYKQRLIKKAA